MQCLALFQLDYLLELLGTPVGIVLAAVMLVLFLLSFSRSGRWIVFTMLLFTSTLSFNETALQVPLIPPFQQIRFAAEPLTVCLLIFLILPSLLVRGVVLRTPVLAAAAIFWILEIIHSVRWMSNIDIEHGLLSLIIFTLILIVLGFGLPHSFRGMDDVHVAARCLGSVAVLFVVGTTAQLAINRSAIFAGNRLTALTGNPQHAAFMLAIFLVPVSLLVSSRRETRGMRIMWGAVTGMVVFMLVWTGSRTGVLTGLIGVGLLFRRRIGALLGVGLLTAIFATLFLIIFHVDLGSDSHILSTQDTRGGVWSQQFQLFWASPVFGRMYEGDLGQRENSYLTIACHLGSIGLTLIFLVMLFIYTVCLRLGRIRAALPDEDDRILIDWIPAALTAIFVGAFFEAVLVGTLTFMLLSFYFYLGVLKFISDENVIEMAEQNALSGFSENNQDYPAHHPQPIFDGPVAF